jgi:hypothetical protein
MKEYTVARFTHHDLTAEVRFEGCTTSPFRNVLCIAYKGIERDVELLADKGSDLPYVGMTLDIKRDSPHFYRALACRMFEQNASITAVFIQPSGSRWYEFRPEAS